MSSSSNSYFLNVNTYFRDVDKYPNPCDFGISFNRFSGTGTFVQGSPLNPSAFFQQCSIDPDFKDSDLSFTNATIDNISRSSTEVVICGIYDYTSDFQIKYQNTTLYYKTGTTFTGYSTGSQTPYNNVLMKVPYLLKLGYDSNAVIPYSFSWIAYIKPASNFIFNNYTSKSTFQITSTQNLYFMFDFSMRNFSFVIYKNGTEINITNISNPTIPSDLRDDFLGNYGNVCVCLTYIDKEGDVGISNGHSYGYHLFSDTYDLIGSESNGSISIETDESENAYVGLNINPTNPIPQKITEPWNVYTNGLFQNLTAIPTNEDTSIFFDNQTGTFMAQTNQIAYSAQVVSVSTGPYKVMFTLDDPSTSYLKNTFVVPETGTRDYSLVCTSTAFTGASSQVFMWISTLPGTANLQSPTGSKIYTVNKTSNFSMTGVAFVPSTGAASVCHATLGGTTYLLNKNLTNYVDIYSFNTTTYARTRLAGLQIPSLYFFIHRIFFTTSGTDIYFYLIPEGPGLLPNTYWNQVTETAYILKYDTITPALTVYNSFQCPILNREPANMFLSPRGSNRYLYLLSPSQNKILVYDISSPSNIVLLNYIQTNTSVNICGFTTTNNGFKKYYLAAWDNTNIRRYYDITDNSNIISLGNYDLPEQVLWKNGQPRGSQNGYIWGDLFTTDLVVNQPGCVTKSPIPLLNSTFSSVQYNQNLSKTTTTPSGATVCCTFNLNNEAYVAFASQTYLTIYNITSIRNSYLVSQIPLGLSTTVYDIRTISYNGSQFFIITGLGYVLGFILSSNLLSITPVGLYTAIADAYLEARMFIYNNSLFAIAVSYSGLLFRFQFTPTMTLTSYVTIEAGKIPGLSFTYVSSSNIQLAVISTTTTYTAPTENFYYYDVSTGISLLSATPLLPGFFPRSSDSLIDPTTGISYISSSTSIAMGIISVENTTPNVEGVIGRLSSFNFQSFDIARANPKTRMFYTDRPYVVSNTYGGSGTSGDYINVMDLTNITYPIQIFNNIKIAGTGATPSTPIYNVDMQISQLNDKVTLVCLNSDGNFYLYDLSNPYFAGQYQDISLTSSSFLNPPSMGSSVVVKLDNGGIEYYKTWLNNVNLSSGPDGQLINVSNLKISNDNLTFYVCGGYKDRMQLYSPDATGTIVNQLYTLGKGYDGYLAKCDAITGKWSWIVPIYGEGDDYVQKIQYTDANRIVLGGYTSSQNLIIYQKQSAGTTTMPTTPQSNIIGYVNNTNSYVCSFTTDGVLSWNTSIYSEDASSVVNILDVGYEGPQIVVTELTNAATIKCIDVSKSNKQELYTYNETINQYSLINYYFDTSGNYLKSQGINLPNFSRGAIADIKLYSSLNEITFCPTITYASDNIITYYNKDGTVAYNTTGASNSIVSYVSNYVYDSYFTDDNGKQYSYVQLQSELPYGFTGSFFKNYSLYMGPSADTTYLNKSYSVRDNVVYSTGDYRFILNSKIDTSKMDRTITSTINGITGTNEYQICSLSSSPLTTIFEYTGTDSTHITSINLSGLDTSKQYYITVPTGGNIYSYNVLSIATNANGDYVFEVEDVNQFLFYSPYLYLTPFNQNIYYNLQFYPASLSFPVYYTIQLNSLVLPNRPLRQSPENYVRTLPDLQYIYVAIYSVDDSDIPDNEIVNIVFDNNPNRDRVEIFQLNTINAGDTSNYVTYTSSQVPKVKFNSQFTTLRIKIFDVYGNVLLFDNTPYKATDSIFTGSVVPPQYMNISIQFTLKKI